MAQKVSIGPGQLDIITKLLRSTVLCSENELAKSQLIWPRTPPACKALAIARGWCVCAASEWKSFSRLYESKKYHKTKQKSIPNGENGVWKVVRPKMEWFSWSAVLGKGQLDFFITYLSYCVWEEDSGPLSAPSTTLNTQQSHLCTSKSLSSCF